MRRFTLVLAILCCLSLVGLAEKKQYIVKLSHPDGKPHGLGVNQQGFSKARHALQKALQDKDIKMKEIKQLGLLNSIVIEIEEEDLEKFLDDARKKGLELHEKQTEGSYYAH